MVVYKLFSLAQQLPFKFEVFGRRLDHEIRIVNFSKLSRAANPLQSFRAILLADFSQVHAFVEVALNRVPAALHRRVIDIAHDDFITRGRSDLGDAVSHRAGAKHTDVSDWRAAAGL